MIAGEAITVRAGRRVLLDAVSLSLRAGEVLAVVGPNGAGKSTLLRALTGERTPQGGIVACEGRTLASWAPLDLARRRAVVSQHVALAFPMNAMEVVALGRLPWHGTPAMAQDDAAVAAALEAVGIGHLARQDHGTLSGGERQRVQLARALAQLHGAPRPAALLLDEPTSSLDVRHAAGVLALLRRLASEGFAVMVVLHDLNEAIFVADRVAVIAGARLVAEGRPDAVLTAEALHGIYGVPFRSAGGLLAPDYAA